VRRFAPNNQRILLIRSVVEARSVLDNDQLNRLALERQRKRQSELKLLLGQQISDNVNS
jgi:hypothetical protein